MRDAIPWHFDWQLYEASGGDRRYSSVNRVKGRVSNVGEVCRALGILHSFEEFCDDNV
jgi:hypothetical protein